jgi:hypothetical protein
MRTRHAFLFMPVVGAFLIAFSLISSFALEGFDFDF